MQAYRTGDAPGYFSLKGLKEKRAKILKEAEGIQNAAKAAGRDMNSTERRNFDNLYNTFMDMTEQIQKHEAAQQGTRMASGPQPTYWADADGKKIRVVGPGEKLAEGPADVSLGECLRTMVTGKGTPDIKNALAEGTDSAGGFTVPTATLTEFIDKFRAKSRVQNAGARILQLDTDKTVIAVVSSSPTAEWKEEASSQSETNFTFAGVTFEPKTLRFIVKASRELMADSLNMNEVLESVFAGTTAAAVDQGILFGSGSDGQIKGLSSYNIAEVDMGTDGAPLESYAPLVQAYQKMLENNAPAPTGFIMNPREWGTLAGLTDTTGQPLRKPEALADIPMYETTGVPVDEVHGGASNASRIITGVWPDLVIGLRSEMRIDLLRERYASTYEYGFLVHMRVDAIPARDESFAQITGIIPASGT